MKQVAFITDIHLQEEIPVRNGVDPERNWQLIIGDVAKRGIKTIVYGGDIGDKSAHEAFFGSLKTYELNLILGNHDQFEEAILSYGADLPESVNALYYTKEDENFRYIFLDSSLAEIDENQFTFLENCLKTEKKIIIFIHHPILEIDTYVDKKYPLKNRDAVLELLKNCPNEITVFSGHYHLYDERSTANIRQVVTPAASYQILKNTEKLETSNKTFGYSIISFHQGIVANELVCFNT